MVRVLAQGPERNSQNHLKNLRFGVTRREECCAAALQPLAFHLSILLSSNWKIRWIVLDSYRYLPLVDDSQHSPG